MNEGLAESVPEETKRDATLCIDNSKLDLESPMKEIHQPLPSVLIEA